MKEPAGHQLLKESLVGALISSGDWTFDPDIIEVVMSFPGTAYSRKWTLNRNRWATTGQPSRCGLDDVLVLNCTQLLDLIGLAQPQAVSGVTCVGVCLPPCGAEATQAQRADAEELAA
jgi:hypothetical protein